MQVGAAAERARYSYVMTIHTAAVLPVTAVTSPLAANVGGDACSQAPDQLPGSMEGSFEFVEGTLRQQAGCERWEVACPHFELRLPDFVF
jgi:hypothetical protein